MQNLFNELSGFRLSRLELYNWGTFDGEIYVMNPEGQTAVLTGANGSGKSTVVDALLTLLVEGRARNYNLASGAGSSRERNERSYVRGQYSRSRGENAIDAMAKTLRDSSSHSVLLAVFQDMAQDRIVTLAQILWISNADKMDRRLYVANCDLNIEQHFPQRLINARDLPEGVESFGSVFKNYIAAARKALGLGGRPKALDLFNETVAVKEIASLNAFVRDHMLDRGDPEARVEALRSQYRELNDAHTAIQRAGRQIAILAPLVKAAQEYHDYETRMSRYEAAKTLVPYYVAGKGQQLLQKAMRDVTSQREAQQSRLNSVDAELETLRTELESVKIAIAQDSVGQMKREIEGKLPSLQRETETLKRAADRYDVNAKSLDLPPYQNEDDFYNNRSRAELMLQTSEEEIISLEDHRSDRQLEQRYLIQQAKERDEEIRYLRENLSNIPAKVAGIRQRIVSDLKLPIEDLPFVGELLRVRDGEGAWEGVLERLLHSFAQDLIVPEVLYPQVSRYVNDNNLRGRLVYRRVDPALKLKRLPERREQRIAGAMAYDKIEIKEDTPYQDWLINGLMKKFDYVCCDSLDAFSQATRAITQQGQIKHSASRHEKDDRRDLSDRRHYVLGWDNRDKLRQLEAELDRLQRRLATLQEDLEKTLQKLDQRRNDIRFLQTLLTIESFSEIDWRTRQAEVDRLQRDLEALAKQSQHLQRLEQQRDQLQRQLKETDRRRDDVKAQITTLDNQLTGYQRKLKEVERYRQDWTDEHERLWNEVGNVLEEVDSGREALTVETLDRRSGELENSINRSIANFTRYQNESQSIILDAMNTFRREYADEGASLTADIASMAAYEAIHQRLEKDDLPQYEERFKQMLDRHVATSIQDFMAQLDKQERDIDRSIAELNDSLSQIDYGGKSIIRLIAEPAPDFEIKDFRSQLRGCIPDMGDNSREERQRVFGQIQSLIERFDTDPNWMRRVIDVRRWRVFAAEQIDASGTQIDYYSDSSGKSGGQKAKLAYTILASAIAYQYGLQDSMSSERSFRFVVVDEAFSKLDDENARFAMKLFKQLGLQLLVITPQQQLHVIEDYVKAYHIVVNNDEGSHSRLFNLTQAEYKEHRREIQGQPS